MSAEFKRIHIIINPASGKDKPILNTLYTAFKDYDVRWDISITREFGDAARLAREVAASGVDLVVACGGDGTVMNVANGLIGSDVPLAILPGGTGNVVVTELGIPAQFRRAADLICSGEGRLRLIDVGRADDDQYFLLRADMGAPTQIAVEADRDLKHRYGTIAYVISTIKTLNLLETAHYRLNLDGVTVESLGIACFIANMGTIGKMNLSLGSDVSPSDGILDVYIVNIGLMPVVSVFTNAVANILELRELGASLQHWRAREIAVYTGPLQDVHLDAEPWGQTPIKICVVPKALQVLVPRG